ncbi:GFA family protein [Hoeflea poritis]|uniref:GFA family protein n=1 Tax=Hoeflea poritis TaxID=2993659 RepID=A0ABT4VKC2_9HYPH|nr:GFA family protein [Hoeflea poritis]MDA4845161.1 GFA family protein [Hoeflea poritis]
MMQWSGSCNCTEVSFRTSGRPIFRAVCHCSICQEFNAAEYADILTFRARDIDLNSPGTVAYKSYKKPPLLRRGRCNTCGTPVIEKLNIPLFPKLILVPVGRFAEQDLLPARDFHIFYDCRVKDVPDNLPKASGYLQSQTKFAAFLMRRLLRGRN